jgi:hypothetical protein
MLISKTDLLSKEFRLHWFIRFHDEYFPMLYALPYF